MARKYDFIIACDNSVVGHTAIDALPLVFNPSSPHYNAIHSLVASRYEIKLFPQDASVLEVNSSSITSRLAKCERNAQSVLRFLQSHSSIETVLHPSIGSTSGTYTSLLRGGKGDSRGSYGNVMSIVFGTSEQAERFYNAVNICKGASFGTNFTLAIPYVQLAISSAKDKLAKYGVPPHIIRLSVGMEDSTEIIEKLRIAIDLSDDGRNR